MTRSIHKITAAFLIFMGASAVTFSPALAEPQYGLAMTGTPKYTADFAHVDYARSDAPKGGTLTQSAAGTFDSLNPYAIKGVAAQGLAYYYDRLMQRVWDEPFTLYPLIAENVEVPEDRSSITFKINPAARFHDGSPITADDVLFSFETLRDHGRPNMRRVYKLVSDASVQEDGRVKFTLGAGYDQETVMIIAMMPVLSKAWWSGKTFDSAVLEAPLSNGPYKITSFEPGRRIVYERVHDYWAKDLAVNVGHNNFDKLVFDYFRDDTIALEAFKAGDIDLRREWDAGKWTSSYDIPAVKDGRIVKDAIPHQRPERTRALIFNTRRAPFDDVRVRKALNYLFDFQWINDNLFHGQYKRIDSYYPNSELAARGEPSAEELALLEPFRANLPPEVFGPAWQPPMANNPAELRENMRKADALLKEAGWVVKDGKRVRADDPAKAFSFEIIVNAPEDNKIALHFKRSLEKMGIAVNIRNLDTANFIGRVNDYDFDMLLHFWQNTLSPGTEQVLYWTCAAAEEKSRWNYPGICNPAIDDLSGRVAAARSRDELKATIHALDRALTHGWYIIPLYYGGSDMVAYRSTVKRPETVPMYGLVLETFWGEPAPAAAQKGN